MLPVYDADQVADYLVSGHWGLSSGQYYRLDTRNSTDVTYNLSALNADAQILARAALDAWENVTPLEFRETTGSATLTFQQSQPGAYASFSILNNYITTATINVSEAWLVSQGNDLASYGFQTYVHEVGHILGLGHPGDYDGSADWAADGTGDNHYVNDSWQMSVMSYFSQSDNTEVTASNAFVVAPQDADIRAVELLYGTSVEQTGDTVWGNNGTTGSYLEQSIALSGNISFSIHDSGGTDTLDASLGTANQTLDLRPGSFSDLWGERENVQILQSSQIENATGGTGADTLRGNDARNVLEGGRGDDALYGGRLKDTLRGGDGDDRLFGEHGLDVLEGGGGNDFIRGGVGNDVLRGGSGNDNLSGGSGADLGLGGAGADLVFGNFGADELFGFGGRDELRGGAGADKLFGGLDADRLVGGPGDDALNGGFGADRFVFTTFSGNDTIEDFEVGVDTLGLAAVSAAQSYDQVMDSFASATDAGVLIDWDTGSVMLSGVALADLGADDFAL